MKIQNVEMAFSFDFIHSSSHGDACLKIIQISLTFFNFYQETTGLVVGFQMGWLDQGLRCQAPAPDHKYKCGISNTHTLSFKTIDVTHCPSLLSFSNLMMWMKWRLLGNISTAATGSINLFLQTGQATPFLFITSNTLQWKDVNN